MPSFSVNDGTGFVMNYEIHQGVLPRTTLFIHGNLASNRWWNPVREVLTKQAQGKNETGAFIAAEFRGCGLSSAPRQESEVDMHRFVDDFIGLVQSLHLPGPIDLVGHSTGGLIVALMLAKVPRLFNKAVMLDPVGPRGVQFEPAMGEAFEQMKSNKDLVAFVLGSTIYGNNPESSFFKQAIVEDGFSAVKAVGHLVVKALGGLDSRAEVAKIQHPVLVLHGEFDTLLDRKASEEMASLIKNAQFRVIEGQGHCTNVENPEKLAKILRDFLY